MALVLSGMSHAQSWCPPGAAWTFEYGDQMFNAGVHRINYTGDTLIDGHQAQLLEHWVHFGGGWGQPEFQTFHWADLYTYEDSGVVYLQGGWPLAFDTVMWFSAQPGDHWGVPDMDGWTFMVLDTSTYILDGMPLRQLVVQVEPEGSFPVDTLRERIGYQMTYIRPSEAFVIDGNYGPLRCYEDDAVSYSRPWVTDCGYTMTVQQSEKRGGSGPFPNPGTDHFSLAIPSVAGALVILDATGRVVGQQRTTGGFATVDTSALPPGVYRIRVDGIPQSFSWMKDGGR